MSRSFKGIVAIIALIAVSMIAFQKAFAADTYATNGGVRQEMTASIATITTNQKLADGVSGQKLRLKSFTAAGDAAATITFHSGSVNGRVIWRHVIEASKASAPISEEILGDGAFADAGQPIYVTWTAGTVVLAARIGQAP